MQKASRKALSALMVAALTFFSSPVHLALASNQNATLYQCANGSSASPQTCTGSAWQHGNLNTNQAHYVEGDSAPYRLVLTGLSTGTHTVEIEYDILKSGKHAIDYLTSYDRTETTADPCDGYTCSSSSQVAIPAPNSTNSSVSGQPTASFNAISSGGRNLTIFNGTSSGTGLTYVSEGDLTASDASTRMKLEFTASDSTVVLAWGGHIGSSLDWGNGNSASGIHGSPYHMRLIDLDGSGGNQDRSMSAGSIIAPSTLTVVKTVVNDDGGTAVAADFPLFVNGNSVTTGVANTLVAGTYTVTETQQSGYSFTGFSGDCDSTGHVTLVAGNNKTCVLTNDDIAAPPPPPEPGTLTVIKHVINDDGGSSTAGDFTLNVTGSNASPASFSGSEDGTTVTLDAGGYSVSEDAAAGYTASYSADCSGSIAAGETKTCTVTNDDNAAPATDPGTLIVIKHVINDDGGSSVASDFTLNVTGSNASPASFTGDASGTTVTLDAGDYSVSESEMSGYTASYGADCSGSIASGETKTCTVTNDDNAAPPPEPTTGTITVVKVVNNDAGGEASVSDFPLYVGETHVISGESNVFDPGTYAITETNQDNYVASYSSSCAEGSLTLAAGDDLTCTITNTYVAPPPPQSTTVTVVKTVINDNSGSNVVSDFTLKVGETTVTSGVALDVEPGTYTVSESGPTSGYAATFGGACDSQGNVTVESGQDAICTLVNDDIAAPQQPQPPSGGGGGGGSPPPYLTIITVVINDDGGTAGVGDFTASVLSGTTNISVPGAGALGATTLMNPGSYSTTPDSDPGYTSSMAGDCSGSLSAGQSKTCTITYDDIPAPPPPSGSPTPPPPPPEVLGATDEATSTPPAPEVLGAVDELPRTGMPVGPLMTLLLLPGAVLLRKRS